MPFEKEEIPNDDHLFRWVFFVDYDEGVLNPKVFENQGKGMSTDWSKYANPSETKNRVSNQNRNPDEYGVLKMNVGAVKKIEKQIVNHTPSKKNRSHTDVEGEKSPQIKVLYQRIYEWAIEPPKNK